MGIDPVDFKIYKELGIFDDDGNHKNIFVNSHDHDHEEIKNTMNNMTTDEKFDAYLDIILDRMIIRQSFTMYTVWRIGI